MPRRHQLCSVAFRLLFVAGALCLFSAPQPARADDSDVSLLFVRKSQLYRQFDGATPEPEANPFTFEAGANPTGPNTITSAQFTSPRGDTLAMTDIGGGFFFFDGGRFASQTDLDAAFPDGIYQFNLETVTPAPGTPYNDSIVTGNQYPNNIPTQQNGTWSSGALQVDATQDYTFNWNDVSPTTGTRMVFEIRDDSGVIVFSQILPPDPSGFDIDVTMVAGTLAPGSYYTAKLAFERRVVTTVSPTLTKVSTYAVEETFKIATIAASPPTVTGPSKPLGTVGQLFVYQIIASDHPFSYSASDLPAGLTLNSELGIITGIPTDPGSVPAVLSAGNINGVGIKDTFQTDIQAPPTGGPVIVSSTSASGYAGLPFKFQVVTKGATDKARITVDPPGLPAGLSLDPVTGKITGTPGAVGSFTVNLTVTDGAFTVPGFIQLTFTADPGFPIITNADTVFLPKNQPFTYKVATPGATDPDDPVSYDMFGVLPAGLGFDPATGTISGTYTGAAPTSADGAAPSPDAPTLSGGALLGSIQLFGTNSHGTSTFQLLFLAPPTGAVNIATRLFVGTGENVLIGGFIITGNAPKVVIVRGIGPSLGLATALQDPVLELHDSKGGVVTNDDWKDTQEQLVKDTTIPPTDNREAAIVIGLDPGNYTAILSGKNGATGIGLVELYDLGTASVDSGSKAQLAQISTRGNVLQGDNVMIGGFIVSGATTKVIVRAIGPSLKNFGIANALADPSVELFNGNGVSLALNDDWKDNQEQAIKDTGVPPTDDLESAIVSSLAPGPYTAIVRGTNNSTGVALVEVFGLP